MENVLNLELEKNNDIVLTKESKNIFETVGNAFSNTMNKIGDIVNVPDEYKEKVTNQFKNFNAKEVASAAAETALRTGMKSLGMKVSVFDNIKNLYEAIKEGDLKNGLSKGIDLALSMVKLPSSVKNAIKSGKTLILENAFEDELKKVMEKQKNTISRIDKKCEQLEKALEESDEKTINRVSKTLKTDLEKVLPIEKTIEKGRSVLNKCELFKNKDNTKLTQAEVELCEKFA